MTNPQEDEARAGSQAAELRRIAAELEGNVAGTDETTHDAMARSDEVSTGSPELDATLRNFSRTYAQQIAQVGDATDRVIEHLRSAADHLDAAELRTTANPGASTGREEYRPGVEDSGSEPDNPPGGERGGA